MSESEHGSTPTERAPHRSASWRRVSKGLLLIGIGAFLLLNTQGVLPWWFWYELVQYWPVLLVAVGIRLVFQSSRAPWAVLLSPLVILGTMAYVAASGPQPPPGRWVPLTAERPEGLTGWTLRGSLALAHLDLKARPLSSDLLVEGRVASNRQPSSRIATGAEYARVYLRSRRRRWIALAPTRRERWELDLAQELPLRLDMDLSLVGGEIDLTAAALSRLDIDGALNDLTLRLGVPIGDERVRLDLEGAFNRIELVVPESVPVRVDTDGFLNSVGGRRSGRSFVGPGYTVRLHGAFNRAVIRSTAIVASAAESPR